MPGLRSCGTHRGRCHRRRATTEKDTVFYINFLLFLKCSVYPLPVMEEEFDNIDFNLLTLPFFKEAFYAAIFSQIPISLICELFSLPNAAHLKGIDQ